MQVQDGLRNDLLPAMSGAQCRERDCAPAGSVRAADAAVRQRAYSELGVRLGLDFADLSSALRAMVARTSKAGEDAVPDVLRSIDAALEQTGKALRKAGFSDEQVSQALDSVRESLGASAAASAEVTAAQSTTYVRKDKANLAITTQEGDRVQIRFRNREGVVSQTTGSAAGEERRVYAFSSGRIEISVQGELNDDELAAITELVGKVEALASDFFAGDVQKAFEAAASLGFDSEQIAGFALRLSTRERFEQRTTGSLPLPARPPIAPAASPAAPAIEAVPADTVAGAAGGAATAPSDAAAAAPAATDVATTGDAATTPPAAESVQNTLANYLRQVLGALSGTGGAGGFEFSMKWKLEVVVAAVKAQAPTPAGTPASNLLTGSLQSLGEKLASQPATAAAKTATAAA